MRVTSREYKVIVDTALFVNQADALVSLLDDTDDLAQSLGLRCNGAFDMADPKQRSILFLDTPDFTLRQNGLLLRQRVKHKSGTTEYTLKCRTEDRYIAAGRELSVGKGLRSAAKFEEDIACPFVSRFSQSATVTLDEHDELAGEKLPSTLAAATRLFPRLLAVPRDGLPCAPETTLLPVNNQKVLERVFLGPTLHFAQREQHAADKRASVALIVWSKGKRGRLLTAEYSFRYADENEIFPAEVAATAKRFFERLQHMDWARPEASTKTQTMYGNT